MPCLQSEAACHLDEELFRFGLGDLGSQNKVFDVVRKHAEQFLHLVGHQLDAVRISRHVGGVKDPLGIVLPGPHVLLVDEAFDRGKTRTTVVTDLAHKMRRVFCVIRALEVISRAPQMVFGHELHLSSGNDFRGHVGRAGKIWPIRIALEDYLRQDLSCDLVVRRIQP